MPMSKYGPQSKKDFIANAAPAAGLGASLREAGVLSASDADVSSDS